MPKLFLAVELPASATEALARLQPPRAAGIRPAARDQMHLTLHFLGEADLDRISAAVQAVDFPAFKLTLEGVGHFSSSGGTTTLWAGIRESPPLMKLHEAVVSALTGEGFQKEVRPYTPHITLARCEPDVSARVTAEFLSGNAGFQLEAVSISAFGVFSSSLSDGAPIYRLEKKFPLAS